MYLFFLSMCSLSTYIIIFYHFFLYIHSLVSSLPFFHLSVIQVPPERGFIAALSYWCLKKKAHNIKYWKRDKKIGLSSCISEALIQVLLSLYLVKPPHKFPFCHNLNFQMKAVSHSIWQQRLYYDTELLILFSILYVYFLTFWHHKCMTSYTSWIV